MLFVNKLVTRLISYGEQYEVYDLIITYLPCLKYYVLINQLSLK